MKRWISVALGLGALALLAGGPLGTQLRAHPALAAQTWQVTVGTDIEAELIEQDSFFPEVLTINAGDTVNWNFAGFHTVTFNAGRPDLPLIAPRADGALVLGPGYFPFPAGPNPPSGAYDGSTQISSGTPPDTQPGEAPPPFTLTFTKAGTFHYVCAVHPGMEADVVVVPAGQALPETPDQAQARAMTQSQSVADAVRGAADQAEADLDAANATAAVGSVDVGLSVPEGGAKLDFVGGNVTVPAGGSVVFTNNDGFNPHTVTFTGGAAPPDFISPEGDPNAPGPPTLVIPAAVAAPSGGSVYSGGAANSGIMFHGDSYTLTFATPGSYDYLCLVHPFMMGTITVTP